MPLYIGVGLIVTIVFIGVVKYLVMLDKSLRHLPSFVDYLAGLAYNVNYDGGMLYVASFFVWALWPLVFPVLILLVLHWSFNRIFKLG
jgi:hypothetical protein